MRLNNFHNNPPGGELPRVRDDFLEISKHFDALELPLQQGGLCPARVRQEFWPPKLGMTEARAIIESMRNSCKHSRSQARRDQGNPEFLWTTPSL